MPRRGLRTRRRADGALAPSIGLGPRQTKGIGVLGTIPTEGQAVTMQGFRFTAEKVQGRRVTTVLVTREVSQGA